MPMPMPSTYTIQFPLPCDTHSPLKTYLSLAANYSQPKTPIKKKKKERSRPSFKEPKAKKQRRIRMYENQSK